MTCPRRMGDTGGAQRGCVKALWYYTYVWKSLHVSELNQIEYINFNLLRNMERDGELEHIVI
jgi:hypothetical protein